jgi:hypothetical protein
MSRINELKKQNPAFDKSVLDYIQIMLCDFKPKYYELFLNLIKNKISNQRFIYEEFKNELISYGIPLDIIEKMSDQELLFFTRFVGGLIERDDYKLIREFAQYNERNLIEENDITKIKSFEQLNNIVSLVEIKSWSKELESQSIVLLDNNQTGWFLIKPLTYEASKKYGSTTKWCTTNKNNPEYFYKYYRGVLIYCINRKSGKKVAMHCHLDGMEVSFWNSEDIRIDSIFSGLDEECIDVIKREIILGKSNYDLVPDDLKSLENEYQYENELVTLELPMVDRPNAAIGIINEAIPQNYENAADEVVQNREISLTMNDIFPDWIMNRS